MARRWRIRHKLTLGLILVVGIMALLLLGTLKGLYGYRQAMKTINSKLAELQAAQQLQGATNDLVALTRSQSTNPIAQPQDADVIQQKITQARGALELYRLQLSDTLIHHRDPDDGVEEINYITTLDREFRELAAKTKDRPDAEIVHDPTRFNRRFKTDLEEHLARLQQTANDLSGVLYTDVRRRIQRSRVDYEMSLWIIGSTSVLGAVLMLGLTRLAYRWIVDPIRDLHEKVGRVAQGDFDSRIEVQSNDEMQDLAAAFNDMTGRLQSMYRDLARQVNERSRQLVRSERLAGVGFLAAGVAHEINNPLASIAFCSEALQRRFTEMLPDARLGPDAETIANYLTMIHQEAFRCKEITQKLLEFSRVGERQRELTDLAQLIQGVLDMVHHLQSHKGKQIVFEPRELPLLSVNAQEIKSVVLNLVVNALDSMEENGILTIHLDVQDGMALMTFADTGCGMTDEVLENIFEPFFTRSRTGKGVGLGLSISHRVITQHGGEIEASSAGPRQGSTFTVRLPLRAPVAVEEESLARAA